MIHPSQHAVQSTVTIRFHTELRLDVPAGTCTLDGKDHEANVGMWMFYLPDTEEKFLHANEGMIDCISPSRPTRVNDDYTDKNYVGAEWRSALATPLERRLSELWIASARLWKAGLGPRPLGLTFAERVYRDGLCLGPTMGLISENVEHLPTKPLCSDHDMISAGVTPDKIRSSVRQQMRGYVVDLCSVVGVQPIDAGEEILSTLRWIIDCRAIAAGMRSGS
jgi:hypothetical protein